MSFILIIDDEEDIRLLYRKELEANNYRVFAAATISEAKDIFSCRRFDAVVLDIQLAQDKSGIDILKWMRTIDKSIPIIINTAYPAYKHDFTTWLADEYIVKSGDLDELIKAIEKLTKKSKNKK